MANADAMHMLRTLTMDIFRTAYMDLDTILTVYLLLLPLFIELENPKLY